MLLDSASTVSKSFTCRVGLLPIGVFIESPRTGKRLRFGPLLKRDLPRVWGRIHQQASIGKLKVEFTRDELCKLKELDDERHKPIDLISILGSREAVAKAMNAPKRIQPMRLIRRGW